MAEPSTRDRLVFTALQLFAEKGYGSTSVADVRQAADVHSGSLYHFFPGKQEGVPFRPGQSSQKGGCQGV